MSSCEFSVVSHTSFFFSRLSCPLTCFLWCCFCACFSLFFFPGMPPDIADMPSASVAFSMMFGERPQEEVSDRGWGGGGLLALVTKPSTK